MVDERRDLVRLLGHHDRWTELGTGCDWRSGFAAAGVRAAAKAELERDYLDRLVLDIGDVGSDAPTRPEDVAAELRRIAAADAGRDLYRWLADEASTGQLVDFLSLEGGPDAGFDDLVALGQVGLRGRPKMALAVNYWDEMGAGRLEDVHTELHHRMARALGLRAVPRLEAPLTALRRAALGGVLATNRWLQPELVGALGLIELQAGPRCRQVVAALRRLDAPPAAEPFYAVHADTDPVHGRDWLAEAVVPLVTERPAWGPRIVAGARWRAHVDGAFLQEQLRRSCLVAA